MPKRTDSRQRLSVDITEFDEKIKQYAVKEHRTMTHMVQQLISEAIAAREAKENKDLIG